MKKFLKKIVNSFPSSIILMLHEISETLDEKRSCSLCKDKFEFLLSQFDNWSSLDDIIVNKAKKRICLTFDDGYADIYNIVYPLCKERNIPFTVFVTCNLIDTENHLSKEQLLDLSKSPIVTIGSHDLNHVPLPSLSSDKQFSELVDSKEKLETLIGKPVKYLAYPYGQQNKETSVILKTHKPYTHAFLAGGLCYNWLTSLKRYKLPRLFVANSSFDFCLAAIKKYTS